MAEATPDVTKSVTPSITFSTFLEQFYNKASKKGFDLRPRLSFLLGLTNDSKRIKKKLEMSVKEFGYEKMCEINDVAPRLSNSMDKVFDKTIETEILYNDFILQLESQLPIETDKIFKKWYEKWKKEDIEVARLQVLNQTIPSIALKYAAVHEEFKEHMKAADQTKVIVEGYIDSANTSFNDILKITPASKNGKYTIREGRWILRAIKNEQDQWLVHLESMNNILKWYNEQRLIAIDFIIGLRDTLEAGRNEVDFTF